MIDKDRLALLEEMESLTPVQKGLCRNILLSHWSGPKHFARNIIAQGWCSPKQEQAMFNIVRATRTHSPRYYSRGSNCPMNSLDHDQLSDFTGWQGEF